MKTKLLLIALCISTLAFTQEYQKEGDGSKKHFHNKYRPQFRSKSTIDVIGGMNTPTGDLKTFAGNGFGMKLVFHQYFGPNFSLGLGTGYSSFSDLNTVESSGNWRNISITAGPEYSIYLGRFIWQFYGHFGASFIETPHISVYYNENASASSPIITQQLDANNATAFTGNFGTNFSFGLSEKVLLVFNTEYVTNFGQNISYQTKDISEAIRDGKINPDIATKIPFDDKNLNVSSIRFQLGISYQISIKKPSNNLQIGRTEIAHNDKVKDFFAKKRTANPNGNADENNNNQETAAKGRRKARKECLESGGVFWERQDSWFCMRSLSTEKVGNNTDPALQKMNKRKCWRKGGTWITNSNGVSFCYIRNNTSKTSPTENPNSNVDKNNNNQETARKGRRKARKECLESGGVFWERQDSWFCMRSLSTEKVGNSTDPTLQKMNKRKCWRKGGTWVTNSNGSFCWGINNSTNK